MASQPTPPKQEKGWGKHPTQKPLRLLERVIASSTSSSALVLDPFSGSGTTGVAALALGHRFVGIDLDPLYLGISKRRLNAAAKSARRGADASKSALPASERGRLSA